MLIRPHDAPIDSEREWRDLVTAHPFGHLIAPGKDREFPVVVPTHIHFDGDVTIRLHLARPNPVWPALRENPRCLFVVTAAVAYVPTSWEAEPGTPAELSTPSSIRRRRPRLRAAAGLDGYQRRNAPGDADALAHLRRRHPPQRPEQPCVERGAGDLNDARTRRVSGCGGPANR